MGCKRLGGGGGVEWDVRDWEGGGNRMGCKRLGEGREREG